MVGLPAQDAAAGRLYTAQTLISNVRFIAAEAAVAVVI